MTVDDTLDNDSDSNGSSANLDEGLFYNVSFLKFIALSFFCGGFYKLYWTYKNWVCLEKAKQERCFPIGKTLFAPIFIIELLQDIKKEACKRGYTKDLHGIILGLVIIVFVLLENIIVLEATDKSTYPFFFAILVDILELISFIPYLIIQKYINDLNIFTNPKLKINNRFTIITWVLIVSGLVLKIDMYCYYFDKEKQIRGILSEKAYMKAIERRIKSYWHPPFSKQSRDVVVLFTVNKNGTIKNIEVSKSSGDPLMDQAAIKAVNNSAPFPFSFPGNEPDTDIEFTLNYNVVKEPVK